MFSLACEVPWGIDWFEGVSEDWDWVKRGATLCFREEDSPGGKFAGLVLFLPLIWDMTTIQYKYKKKIRRKNKNVHKRKAIHYLSVGIRPNSWWEVLMNREIMSSCEMLALARSMLPSNSVDRTGRECQIIVIKIKWDEKNYELKITKAKRWLGIFEDVGMRSSA